MLRIPVCVALAVLVGCETYKPRPTIHCNVGDAVEALGLRLEFESAVHQHQVKGGLLAQKSERGFVVLTTKLTNLRTAPLEAALSPYFELFSAEGKFAHSVSATAALAGSDLGAFESLNPGSTRTRRTAFEAPPGRYMLRVIVPYRLKHGVAYGDEVIVDLGDLGAEVH